ncbi:glycine zipper 2TM domain-containing protein [Hydrogenophaga sp. A37]|uniref:glycine zipper 2TM domain-containing protein n=1 Tax=Hydrogenophaga sp. A37 TaxID=1945864 RepID=UPI00098758D7|nr:glycine zipper 2TM domain-containing protein [Hydrogenophaga sp. A37]OOG80467.1 hypothetical protein B0E41_20680 [Hydrogenophaga sp. A37]
MNTTFPLTFRSPAALAATALAVLTLAACAPYPVYDQPVSQSPVYTTPSQPQPRPDYRRRDRERLYEVDVTSVRAVMSQPGQRCWIEREAVAPQRQQPNVGGAIVGGVIGGILGHQIGGGRGQDIATAGGAVAGAYIGSNVGRDRYGNPVAPTRDVQRCSNTAASSEPAYWDVSYEFRGVIHHVQMSSPPGRSITVNDNGEPRE